MTQYGVATVRAAHGKHGAYALRTALMQGKKGEAATSANNCHARAKGAPKGAPFFRALADARRL